MTRQRLSVLMYHGVVGSPPPSVCWHQLTRDRFEVQVRWLRQHMHPLPLEDALDRLRAGTLPPRACAVTFDDGYQNVAEVAAPILEALEIPSTVFLVTDLVGTTEIPWPDRLIVALRHTRRRVVDATALGMGKLMVADSKSRYWTQRTLLHRLKTIPAAEQRAHLDALVAQLDVPEPLPVDEFGMMDWHTVRALAARGLMSFGAHTTNHCILSRQTEEEVVESITRSQESVTEALGRSPRVFAYPNGRSQDFDARAVETLRALGVPFALSTVSGRARRKDAPHRLPRIPVGGSLTFAGFRLAALGIWRA